MKKLVLILALLLVVQSYGVWGAAQAKRIMYTCTLEVGPLCYAWEENTFGKLIGADKAEEVEKALSKARKKFDEDFIERFTKKDKKSGLDKLLDAAGKGIDRAAEAAAEAIEGAKE